MKQIIALYETDFNHTNDSKILIGVFTSETLYKKAIKKIITEDIQSDSGNRDYQEEKDYIKWNIDFMLEKKQTQGLNNFELISEIFEANVINK